VTRSPYARAPDLTVMLSRIVVQYLTLIFHQHTEAKDVITSKFLSIAVFVTLLFETVLYILPCNEIIIFNTFKIAQSVQVLFTARMTEVECCGGVLTFV
jgi:hypothetical protein